MRFATRFDGWLVALIGLGCVVGLAVPVTVLLQTPAQGGSLWLMAISPVVILFALSCTLPQYYEVREDGLFIRQGWRKFLLPYASLVELQQMTDLRSAAVFSTHRILIVTDAGPKVLIAVAEEERFLAEVLRHSPQLEPLPTGLKVPFAASMNL